ncbi:MAG: glutathione transferase [Burkholderiaceae bacterium]|jgi:glutathione S-transferase|nr:glutathione transferase [Burkholderiaceae bacterium]
MLLYVDNQYASPYAMSVFVALHEKAVPFRVQTVDLSKGQNKKSEYTAISLTQRVPTLVQDGFALSESSAITEYLNETFPGNSLYPSDPRSRAKARQVQAWLRSDLMPIRQERTTEVIFYGRPGGPLSSSARVVAEHLFAVASALLPGGSENLFGAWCIADVDLALMLNRLIMNGDTVPKHLVSYAQRQWERASVQQWVKQQRPPLVNM